MRIALFEPEIARRLLAGARKPITVTIDAKDGYDADDMKVATDGLSLRAIGKTIETYDAESIGFGSVDGDLWQVGVIVPVGGAGNVHVAYGEVDLDSNRGAESWTVAYTHALSKRTTAYVGYNSTENESATGGFGLVGGTGFGDDSDLFVAGVRHTF